MAKRQSMQQIIGDHVNEIRQLSSDRPIDEIELIRDGHRIVANAYQIFWLGDPIDRMQLMGIAFDQAPTLAPVPAEWLEEPV